MKVIVPSALHSYTDGKSDIQASGATLADVLADLDSRYPGLRFRIVDEQNGIRRHIKIFINQTAAQSIGVSLRPDDRVLIVCALSGG